MSRNFYITREEVYDTLDFKGSILSAKKIDSAISSASRSIEALVDRKFYPSVATKYFDATGGNELWLEIPDMLISATTVTGGDQVISPLDYSLEPRNYGPPYNKLKLNLGSDASFAGNSSTGQVSIDGVWGYNNSVAPATTLSLGASSSETTVDVEDSSVVGIGNILLIGSEYMDVTNKQLVDTTQNSSALNPNKNDVSITGVTGLHVDEIIQIDSEQMKIISVAGTTLTVERAYGGTVLAVHHNGSDIYAYRRLVVSRGVNGSTATSHLADTVVSIVEFPADIVELCLAETVNILQQRLAGYGRTVGTGDNLREAKGAALAQMRSAVIKTYRRYKLA